MQTLGLSSANQNARRNYMIAWREWDMKLVKLAFPLLFFVLLAEAQNGAEPSTRWAQFLPNAMDGWQSVFTDGIYHVENLYDYLDGGAEVYLSYGFRMLIHRIYRHSKQPDILLDFYDMGNGENSYGLFLHLVQKPDSIPLYGQGSYFANGYLVFQKGPFLISILAFEQTPQSEHCLKDLAHFIDQKIRQTAALPSLPKFLPKAKQIPHSLRYFHSYFWLQRAFNLPKQNIFRISDSVKVALARYSDGTTLALIAYPIPHQTQRVKEELFQNYFHTKGKSSLLQKGKAYYLLATKGNILIFGKNEHNPESIKSILLKLQHLK